VLGKGDALKTVGSHGQCRTVIREILCYLVEHPDAKDTVDGIFKFWLPKGAVKQGKKEVQKALNFLVIKKGWLTERNPHSSEKLYGLNKVHLREIKIFLRMNRP